MTQRAINGPFVYFVTTNTAFRKCYFDVPEKVAIFANLLQGACQELEFVLFGYCVMPDHVHLLVLRKGRTTLSTMMNAAKGRFSKRMPLGRFWQPRFNFRIVETDDRFFNTVEYIRHNYRKAGLPREYGQPPWVFIDREAIKLFFDDSPAVLHS